MKFAIVGYGRMGKSIQKLAEKNGHTVTSMVDTADEIKTINPNQTDIAFEFTCGTDAYDNLEYLIQNRISVVSGTTGMRKNPENLRELVEKYNAGFLWASNFAIGVNLFFYFIKNAANIFDAFDEFDVYGNELHHRNKSDSPSGTAKTVTDILIENIKRKKRPVFSDLQRPPDPDELHFSSSRGGYSPGEHSVYFESELETLEITHRAKNRDCFALGALKVAEWLVDKKGFYGINDYFNDVFIH